MRTAVTLYERATNAAGKRGERGSVKIADKLTTEQLADHSALVDLRQKTFAHVYVSEEIDGQVWHRDLLFAVESGTALPNEIGGRGLGDALSPPRNGQNLGEPNGSE